MQSEFIRQFMARHDDFQLSETLNLTCEKHGPYTNTRLVQVNDDGTTQELPLSGCPECNEELQRKAMMELYVDDIHSSMFNAAQIPDKYSPCMLRNFRIEDNNPDFMRLKGEARQKCLDFIEDRIRSIVLLGPTDRGKSHLAVSMLKGCIQTGRQGLYVRERKIYRDIHESYLGRKELPTEGQVIAKYSEVPVLVIDELGRSTWSEHEGQTLYEIIDRRDADNLKTVMSGNINPKEFGEKFDDSFHRKLGASQIVCRWGAWGNAH